MKYINLEDKINGAETVSLGELMLGFLEHFQENASEENFAGASYWDVIEFFVQYLDDHAYYILKSHHVRMPKSRLSLIPSDLKDRCERFYSRDWRKKAKGYLPHAGTKETCFSCGATKIVGLSEATER